MSTGARSDAHLNSRAVLNIRRPRAQASYQCTSSETASSPQQSAECATHDGAADRASDRTADIPAEIGGGAAHHLVGDGARDGTCDQLSGRQPAALDVGAEHRRGDIAELAKPAA